MSAPNLPADHARGKSARPIIPAVQLWRAGAPTSDTAPLTEFLHDLADTVDAFALGLRRSEGESLAALRRGIAELREAVARVERAIGGPA